MGQVDRWVIPLVKKLEFLKLDLAVGHSAVIVPSDSLKLLGRY